MAVRLTQPWRECTTPALATLTGQLGVYEVADAAGRTLYIGCADARSQFGLRSEVAAKVAALEDAASFRVEINTAYHTRWRELLMAHRADHGELPVYNTEPEGLGTLRPG